MPRCWQPRADTKRRSLGFARCVVAGSAPRRLMRCIAARSLTARAPGVPLRGRGAGAGRPIESEQMIRYCAYAMTTTTVIASTRPALSVEALELEITTLAAHLNAGTFR